MTDPLLFQRKMNRGGELQERIKLEFQKAFREIDKFNDASEAPAVAKCFLMSSDTLTDQLLAAVNNGSLFLALLGLRTLLEFDVNAHYIFDHPQHPRDEKWVSALCKDMFTRTNVLPMQKNKLGNKGLKERAAEVGLKGLLEVNYASLSDYTHLALRPPDLVLNLNKFVAYGGSCVSQSLTHYANIVDSVGAFYGVRVSESLAKEVEAYDADSVEAIKVLNL